ncbi:hypothetical protein KSP40_PGU004209 [Platanthera guangdongensis]|uniref:Uncharacterized protein n=1 Tax=Platanthera guangdongensis TaxID=2320717 RepID=A0ABR2LU80_9ASPA
MVAGEELSSAIEKEAIDWPPSPPSMAILDMPSTGSRGSAVVDGEGGGATLDSGGDSYFQESLIKGGCMGLVGGGAVSEEDGGSSDDGCSYLPGDMFKHVSQADNWWVWS